MPEIHDGQSVEVQGSAKAPYVLKNVGGIYSCSCPAWRNQSLPVDKRTCKHLRSYRGEAAEQQRLGGLTARPAAVSPPTAAPTLLLAQTWDGESRPNGWWMSEKLDGLRAYWTGQRFLSRQGNQFDAPAWFTAGLPNMPLDGELWLERRSFQKTVSIVRRHDGGEQWRQIRFVVFDAPAVPAPFEERLHEIGKLVLDNGHYFRTLPHIRCKSREHLMSELERINGLGGEGVMLREPGSLYEPGRSNTLLKVKTFHDAEATIIGLLPGTGRHKGRLGAVLVMLSDGTQFSVGSGFTDAQRDNPPTVGSVITFRYQELSTAGVPRFPTFVRVRSDVQPASSTLFSE